MTWLAVHIGGCGHFCTAFQPALTFVPHRADHCRDHCSPSRPLPQTEPVVYTKQYCTAQPITAMSTDPEIYNLWRIRRTICEMLIDRQYIVSELDLHLPYTDFAATYTTRDNAISFLVNRIGDSTDQLMVFCAEDEKLGVKPIKDYVTRMEAAKVGRAILILKHGITPFAKRILTEMNNMSVQPGQTKKVIELFESDELLVNITKHVFVPKHQLLTPAEKSELLNKYKLKDTQLPRIQQIDPVARYYGLGKGNVVKIIRPSETAGRYVTYRLVI